MSIVCEEIFDENTQLSIEEIRDYASKIGIDPDSEPQLLPLAAEGLMKALPPGWRPCYDEKLKSYYYHNNVTGKTQWEHPLDNIYRGLVKKVRTESQSLSIGEPTEDATYVRDDLPSFEEILPIPASTPSKTEPLLPKRDIKLSPIKAKPSVDLLDAGRKAKLSKQKSEEPSMPTFSKHFGKFNSFDEKNDFKQIPQKELTLSGGGAMFLKSNTKKIDSGSINMSFEKATKGAESQPRSILRERNVDIPKNIKIDTSIEKSEDDDKKIVRFNLDSNTDIALTLSDRSSSDDDFQERNVNKIIDIYISDTKSRFTVTPVKESIDDSNNESYTKNNQESMNKNLKLIKPHPTDFVNPKLNIDKHSDSDEDSDAHENNDSDPFPDAQFIKNKKHSEKVSKAKAKQELERVRQAIWEEKNEELENFKDDMQESHKQELERLLIEEKTKYELKIKIELENLRKEMENRATGALKEERSLLESNLEKEISQLKEHFEREKENIKENLSTEFETEKQEHEKRNKERVATLEKDLEKEYESTRANCVLSHNKLLEKLKENHSITIEELKKEFLAEEQLLRKKHYSQITEIKNKAASEMEADANCNKTFEKIKSEKRLLEDKYRCLKDKYLRLKTDVKTSIEKRNKKKEQSGTATTTGSETERSHSVNKERTPLHSPSTVRKNSDKPPTPKHLRTKPEHRTSKPIIIHDFDTSCSDRSCDKSEYPNKNDNDTSDDNVTPGRSRKKLFSRLKSSSTSRVNNNSKHKRAQRSCSPVENLRRQLQKLEDLEDQIPQNPQPETYHLRYPFESQKFEGSSELEFFRHRIHLERDSIKRARENLRLQKSVFQQRQKDLKLKHGSVARHTLQQLCQEEKDLTDMEVSLHRTRSLLGEKVIRLRHLEQSLKRATVNTDQEKREDGTLSDVSSHSASSGISSTEFATAEVAYKSFVDGEHFQESSEIIQSLENLNSEIKEIWEVLYKQQHQHSGNIAAVLPSLPLVYPDLGWPILAGAASVPAPPSIPTLADRLHNYRQHIALANAQSTIVTHANQGATTTLVERTRNLRQWLRQAGVDNVIEGNPPHTTL